MTLACPSCDSTRLRRHTGKEFGATETEAGWRCKECGREFSEAVDRAPKRRTVPTHGLARELMQSDADAVGGESDVGADD